MDRSRLGTEIRALRKARNLTLREVAEVAGVSYQYVSDVENGQANVTLDALESILCAVGGEAVVTVVPAGQPRDMAALARLAELIPRVSPELLDGVILGLEARAR
jgi:transcriptional regulator with XRE-family HTH domain